MSRVYIDTSAYLCLLLGEDGAAAIAADIADVLARGDVCSSVLLVLEARRNLVRLAREGHLDAKKLDALLARVTEDTSAFTLKDLSLDLCTDAALPAVTTPRSLDLAHLRTALWFHRQRRLDRYVTRDEGQRSAARELGLPVA